MPVTRRLFPVSASCTIAPFSGATDAQKVSVQCDPVDRFLVDSRLDIPLLLSVLMLQPFRAPLLKW